MNATLAAKLNAKKAAYLEATAEFSETSMDELVQDSLAQDSITILKDLCNKIDKVEKAAGITREYDTSPKHEYGVVNGLAFKFISKFVYLRSELKDSLGLGIPESAFSAESLEAWGKMRRCSPLGTISEQIAPNLSSVAVQLDKLKAYLNLPYTESVMSQAQWDIKAERAAISADKKLETIKLAEEQLILDQAEGLPTFTV